MLSIPHPINLCLFSCALPPRS